MMMMVAVVVVGDDDGGGDDDDDADDEHDDDDDQKRDFHSAKCVQKASFVNFIQELIDRNEKVTALEIWRSWIDIDTFEDYRNSWKLIENIGQS